MTHTTMIDNHWAVSSASPALCPKIEKDCQPKDELVATLAHELRTPLGAILSSPQIMHYCAANEQTAREARETAERQTRHMARVIEDVLDISRGSRGKIALHKEPVNVAAVVANAVAAVKPLVASHRQELTVALPPELPRLTADASRLEQVLVNLLTNAAKYTDAGGRIWLTVESTAEAVVLRVRDAGIGIAAEMLPHIFELFVQVDRERRRSSGGLGIGLALVRQLVELHGGSVSVASAGLGCGSEFVVRLPRSTAVKQHNGTSFA